MLFSHGGTKAQACHRERSDAISSPMEETASPAARSDTEVIDISLCCSAGLKSLLIHEVHSSGLAECNPNVVVFFVKNIIFSHSDMETRRF